MVGESRFNLLLSSFFAALPHTQGAAAATMGSSASSGPAALMEQSRAGAPPSCKICLKNAWTRPAGPSAASHLCFLTQRLIGLLRCKREGQLPAQPTAAGSARRKSGGKPPRRGLRRCRGTQGRDRAPRATGSLRPGRSLPCAQGCGDAASSGHPWMRGCSRLGAQGATALFWGLVVYYAAITISQYWQGKLGVSKGFKSPGGI